MPLSVKWLAIAALLLAGCAPETKPAAEQTPAAPSPPTASLRCC